MQARGLTRKVFHSSLRVGSLIFASSDLVRSVGAEFADHLRRGPLQNVRNRCPSKSARIATDA